MNRNIVAVGMLLTFSAALWSCSSSDDKTPEHDQPLNKNVLMTEAQSLTKAVNEISTDPGFKLITLKEDTGTSSVKEGTEENDDDRFSFNHIITLENIKGVYNYILPVADEGSNAKMGYGYWNNAFEKVDDSDFFEINLPQEKATRPWKLYVKEDGDEELDNDFNITASQYYLSTEMSSEGFEFEYLLDADITIEEEDAGEIFVEWNISSEMEFEYESEFGFANGYSVGHEFEFGDTTEFSYYLKKDEDVLFMEEVEYIKKTEETEAEYEYTLSIGNIKIVKNSSSDDYMVYRDDILEEDAVITVLPKEDVTTEEGEEDESEDVFCRRAFDIKITFSDETEVILSELIGEETLSQLNEIFSSMHDMYFVNKLVDRVAREAYQMNMQQNAGE